MATGTQMVLKAKKNKLIIIPSGLHVAKKLDRNFVVMVFFL